MTLIGHRIIDREEVVASNGAVATKHPREAELGIEVLRAGGNAIDAAVAIGFMSTVVEPWMVTLGGVGFMQVFDAATGKTWTVDYLGRAPKASRPDMYPLATTPSTFRSTYATYAIENDANMKGYLSIAVPGLVAGLCEAHRRWGKLPLQALVEPAADRAAAGIPADAYLRWHISTDQHYLRRFPASARLLLPNGTAPEAGATVRQPEFADTLRRIAREGAAGFYAGEVAGAIEGDMKRNGGLITRDDLAAYEPQVTPSLMLPYRDVEIAVGACPNGLWSGLQTLNILEHFDLRGMGHNSAAYLHAYVEAARHALADRSYYLADPDFEPVPLDGMLSRPYAKSLAALVDPAHAAFDEGGDPPALRFAHEALHTPGPWDFDTSGQAPTGGGAGHIEPTTTHTTNFATVDRERNVVVCTQTTGETFGSSVISEGTGIMWNNMMLIFTSRPGTANSVAPWKRTLTSTSPAIVFRNGRPWFAAGAPGGRRIMNGVQQVLLNVIDFGMSIQPAITAPRVDASTETTRYDDRIDPAVIGRLAAMGHAMVGVDEANSPFGFEFSQPTGIMIDDEGRFRAGADPFRLAEARGC